MGPQPDRPARPLVVTAGTGRPDTSARRRKQFSQQTAKDRDENVPGLAARKTAAKLLAAVIEAKTPLDGLTDQEHGHPQFRALEPRDRALVRAILVTALRHRITIEKLISARLKTPLPANATALSFLLHVAAAQILFLDIPDSAAVDLAVTHAKGDPRTTRFAGLVNAVLRGLSRDKDTALPAALGVTEDAPDWFRARLVAAYSPERAKEILAAHRVEAPIDFTVKSDPEGWAERLGGIVLPTGTVRVERLGAPVTDLPGFAEGAWWVQDVAAALPARMLGDVRGLRVADLCAAPGGKTAQLALTGATVTAVESSRSRIARLRGNLERLGLTADIVEAELQGRSAVVTVKFVSEQVNVTRDAEGKVVDGDPSTVAKVTDIWTFSRNTRARDPNWTLVATRSPD